MSKLITSSREIRKAYIDYFKQNAHTEVSSSSLIPENDPTLLFCNAGMNQFKNSFLGLENRPYSRAVSSQKCVRAGGKHNDLENVGFTARHHTFFEMLGNFSFGDYFKKDAIHFAWELLTKELQIPKEKLYVTVFETDDEAADIWHKQESVPRDRIFRLGEKDNFWRMGDTGPCGPSSEIFFDHGPRAGKEKDPFKSIVAGEDRFVEIWNLVFMQYFEKAPGQLDPLPKPSVDTGMGLERVTSALQGNFNNYNTDLFMPMIEAACAKVGWNPTQMLQLEDELRTSPDFAKKQDMTPEELRDRLAALRVMADHTRSASMLIADGALPSNEGRGYVLRRILRRAIRYGQKVSKKDSFLPKLSQVFVESLGPIYPELNSRKDLILSTLETEENRFLQTLETGTGLLEEALRKQGTGSGGRQLSGDIVFKLYDTYGFPADLTQLMAAEKGFTIDEAGFSLLTEQARSLAKKSWKGRGPNVNETHQTEWVHTVRKSGLTQFTGYESLMGSGTVVGLSDGAKELKEFEVGQLALVALSSTSFYGEGGGQVGDTGVLIGIGFKARVLNTTKSQDVHIHHVEVLEGKLKLGDKLETQVEVSPRRLSAANHSATHLLHAALRKVVGTHVTQAGSLVDSEKLRFDFTHTKALTLNEIEIIENLVNEQISHNIPVEPRIMNQKEALASGALALFGEKYGDQVRVLKMGAFSTELCGGTHVKSLAEIRLFKIVSESSVSAGVRRIEALTSDGAFQFLKKNYQENLKSRQDIGLTLAWNQIANQDDGGPSAWIQSTKNQIKDLEKEIRKAKASGFSADSLIAQAKSLPGIEKAKFVAAQVDTDDREVLTQWADQLKNKIEPSLIVLVGKSSEGAPLVVTQSKECTAKFHAGHILKEISAVMGGKGGGKPDFAQGAVPDSSKWPEAEKKLWQLLGV